MVLKMELQMLEVNLISVQAVLNIGDRGTLSSASAVLIVEVIFIQ